MVPDFGDHQRAAKPKPSVIGRHRTEQQPRSVVEETGSMGRKERFRIA